jgi:hypothetical protein
MVWRPAGKAMGGGASLIYICLSVINENVRFYNSFANGSSNITKERSMPKGKKKKKKKESKTKPVSKKKRDTGKTGDYAGPRGG